jgi:hypothetical protein
MSVFICAYVWFCDTVHLKLQYVTFWATQPNSHRNGWYRHVILIEKYKKCISVLCVVFLCFPFLRFIFASFTFGFVQHFQTAGFGYVKYISQRFGWYNDSLHYTYLFCQINKN